MFMARSSCSIPDQRRQVSGIATLTVLALLSLGSTLWIYGALRSSLPLMKGELEVDGLQQPVTVARDRLGVPQISGSSRRDVAFATGFLHGQDRFFQMDLLRRSAAGELAAMFGKAAIALDKQARVHQFRHRARQVIENANAAHRVLLRAYADGVNAGVAALQGRPFEYMLTGTQPQPWTPEDSVLVIYAMFMDLQDSRGERDHALARMAARLPDEVYRFFTPRGTEWDAALQGEALPIDALPGPQVFNPRQHWRESLAFSEGPRYSEEKGTVYAPGSNNWAVAGRLTPYPAAMVAGDMHLELRLPNTWYRASLRWPADGERYHHVTGITLPGTPFIVAGSNGHVAWSFTNSYGDWTDLVRIDPEATRAQQNGRQSPEQILTPIVETIEVKGADAIDLEILATPWGPVMYEQDDGSLLALRWVAHQPAAVNFELGALETAVDVRQAVKIANSAGMPAQNFIAADSSGEIAWTIAGRLPRRAEAAASLPVAADRANRGAADWLAPAEYPLIVNPDSGRLWSANNRLVSGNDLKKVGDGGYMLGARAQQIRDDLLALNQVDEKAMLAIQLDDRALFLRRWQAFLLERLTPGVVGEHTGRQQARSLIASWGGRAATDSVGYRLVRAYRHFLSERLFRYLLQPVYEADETFDYKRYAQWEGPLWTIVSQRPVHMLPPQFNSWDELFIAVMDETIEYFVAQHGSLDQASWGQRNTLMMRHPFSQVAPMIKRWVDLRPVALPGDVNMPRVQGPDFGASQRMVVAPGFEEQGIFHMPGGQSGHPLSPHYDDSHAAWQKGEATPFLPEVPVNILTLKPNTGDDPV
jgi:penicillin amidase